MIIRYKHTNEVIYKSNHKTMKETIEKAINEGAVLTGADLTGADLRRAVLTDAVLTGADLTGAVLRRAVLTDAVLTDAVLTDADLTDADLTDADLTDAVLRGADLTGADLRRADLTDADLTGAEGLLSTSVYMKTHFKSTNEGYRVYKAIGNTTYIMPDKWTIKEGTYLSEVVNPNPTNDCGCGVNFGTKKWVQNFYPDSDIWECLIEWKDCPGIVVPYHTDGKARCERLKLVKKRRS